MVSAKKLKTYEELSFADDFMFCKIMQSRPDLCKELTEMILDRVIGEIVEIEKQYPIEIKANGHGVRFDIYFKDDKNTRYDVEMQTVLLPELPKRSRYYQSMIDLDTLNKSVRYRELPNSFVIFICLDNPFPEAGLHKYSFRSMCAENTDIILDDGCCRIFLSARGTADDISEEMKNFLEYLTDHTVCSDFTRRLDEAVANAKTREKWSVEYMTLFEMREMDREAGRQEGLEEGLKEGLKEAAEARTTLAKKIVRNLAKTGMQTEEIASIVDYSVEQVKEWLGAA